MEIMHKYFVYHGVLRLKEKIGRKQNDFTEVISLFNMVKQQLSPADGDYSDKCSSLEHILSDLSTMKEGKPNKEFLRDLRDVEESFDLPRTTYVGKRKIRF